jgi:hypothetical protein
MTPQLGSEIDAAARRVTELRLQGLVLHFERDGRGRVRIEARDLNGPTVGALRPSEALAAACGGPR